MRATILPALLFSCLSMSSAVADACDSATSQIESNQCARLAYEQADRELNNAYKDLMAGYEKWDADLKANNPDAEPAVSALVSAQRAWITLRDTECHLEGLGTQGGTIRPMIISECLARMTRERVNWLRRKLACEEGDMSCLVLTEATE